MSSDSQSDRRGHHPDGFAEFTEELRLLAEVLLARVEPVLRRTAADGQADLGGCAWCPVCAAAALMRGEHHDVVAALAEHGTSMVTVLREALAGVPVEPVLPPEWAEYAAGHHDSHESGWAHHDGATGDRPDADSHDGASGHSTTPGPGAQQEDTAAPDSGAAPNSTAAHARDTFPAADESPADTATRSRLRWGSARPDGTPRPRRVDEFAAPRPQGAPARPGAAAQVPADTGSGTGRFATQASTETEHPERPHGDRSRPTRAPRSRYVDIPVTIRG
ncbi:hypothetical protein [Nocardia sp. NPDC051833]|uniref:hypothetical protein n=1 Tax=Nocardia sp. NPDC051833 TaxID=3155674 RepID=UPI00341A485E